VFCPLSRERHCTTRANGPPAVFRHPKFCVFVKSSLYSSKTGVKEISLIAQRPEGERDKSRESSGKSQYGVKFRPQGLSTGNMDRCDPESGRSWFPGACSPLVPFPFPGI